MTNDASRPGGLASRAARQLKRLNSPMPLNDFADYDDYWEGRGDDEFFVTRWELAAAKINNGATLLDVGCGTGGFLQYLGRVRPDVHARGTDVSGRAVEVGLKRGLDMFQADLTIEPLDRGYDFVTAFEVLEHVHDAEELLLAMRDRFRCQLIVSCPNTGYYEHRIRLGLFGRFPITDIKLHAKEHIRFWTVRDFAEWVNQYGLRVVDVQGARGVPRLRDRKPSLFASQVVYTLEHAPL